MKLKRFILVFVALACCAMGVTLNQVNPSADQQEWRFLRTVTSNDSALTTATKAWSTVGASSIFVPVPDGWTWVAVSAYGYGDGDGAGDPAPGSFNYNILGVRYGSSAQVVASGTMAVGGLQISHLPYGSHVAVAGPTNYKWVEGPPSASDTWLTSISTSGTTDDIGAVLFATNGISGFTVEVSAIASLTSVTILYTGGN